MEQNAELLITNPMRLGIKDILDESAGTHARSYTYFVGSVSLFILFSNLFSLLPWFTAPTANVSVPLAFATDTLLYFNWQRVRHLSALPYLKHFAAGTKWWITWLSLPVQILHAPTPFPSFTLSPS